MKIHSRKEGERTRWKEHADASGFPGAFSPEGLGFQVYSAREQRVYDVWFEESDIVILEQWLAKRRAAYGKRGAPE